MDLNTGKVMPLGRAEGVWGPGILLNPDQTRQSKLSLSDTFTFLKIAVLSLKSGLLCV